MAPRTRSNRAEKLATEKLLATGIALNSHGFPTLPSELFLEIISYFPAMPIPQVIWLKETTDPHRHITLLALSQTCRALRSVFLRYAWERIEAFGGMWTSAGRLMTEQELRYRSPDMKRILDKNFFREVSRQLETVTVRNPELAQYVRVVNVMLATGRYEHDIYSQLASSLSLLPHVHTLQLACTFRITNYFSEYCYPNIHTVCLQGRLMETDILRVCPNLRIFNQYSISGRFPLPLQLVSQMCGTNIEVLGVLSAPSQLELPLEVVIVGFPRVRDISIDINLLRAYEDDLSCLSSLPLHTLRLYLRCTWRRGSYWPQPFETLVERTRWINLAKKILKNCPSHEAGVKKRVMVIGDQSVVTDIVNA